MKRQEVLEYLKSQKADLEKKYFIRNIGLFGSFARNDQTQDSDIDIIYEVRDNKNLTFSQLFEIESKLQKKFNRKIELVNYKYMNPLIKYKAEKEIIYV